MRPINKKVTRIMNRLVAGLEPGDAKKLDNAKGCYMALNVECVGENLFSLAHYYEQNGDLVADPDMEFYRNDEGRFIPVSITQGPVGVYRRAVYFGADGKPERFSPRACRELAQFAAMWLENIKHQQGV